ncbi:hypothetical protein SCA6_017993 [Theobroma cacao]
MKKDHKDNKSKSIEEILNEGFLKENDINAAFILASFRSSAPDLEQKRREVLRQLKGKVKQETARKRGQMIMLDKYQPPNIPPVATLAHLIGECSRPYSKQLTETDLKDNQIRLSLNKNHVGKSFIPLLKEHEDVNKGIQVITYDPEGKEYPMKFVFWTSKMYVLTTSGWKRFYKDHALKESDIVTVWMFRHRHTHNLCFAITWRRSPTAPSVVRIQEKATSSQY